MNDTTTHDTDRWIERLSEYLDGELAPEERDALEVHLDGCAECMVTLTELRRVSAEARALPEPMLRADVQADLWAAIAPRLAPRRKTLGQRIAAALSPAGGRFVLTVPQLATAALALVMVSAAVTYVGSRLASRRGAPAPTIAGRADSNAYTPRGTAGRPDDDGGDTARGDDTRRIDARGGDAQVAGFDEAHYASAVAELEGALEARRDELDPQTVRALEENLNLIDEAVAEARRALNADPSNTYLSGHLASQMHRKVRVLQRAAMIVAATR